MYFKCITTITCAKGTFDLTIGLGMNLSSTMTDMIVKSDKLANMGKERTSKKKYSKSKTTLSNGNIVIRSAYKATARYVV